MPSLPSLFQSLSVSLVQSQNGRHKPTANCSCVRERDLMATYAPPAAQSVARLAATITQKLIQTHFVGIFSCSLSNKWHQERWVWINSHTYVFLFVRVATPGGRALAHNWFSDNHSFLMAQSSWQYSITIELIKCVFMQYFMLIVGQS